MRWTALEVDYEMSGKDLIDSVRIGSQICRVLGGTPPENLTYELFLDEKGEKISKSKGNGLTIEEWLRYATPESLELFLYKDPRKAKRLYFDVIPRHVDEYEQLLEALPRQTPEQQVANPVWHIHDGELPQDRLPPGLSYAMLLNLASVVNADDPAVLWGFISRYAPGVSPETSPRLAALVERAVAYYRDFVRPAKHYRPPTAQERAALEDLVRFLRGVPEGTDGETIQHEVYEIGKRHGFANLRDWFRALYEVLLGQSEGPRFGSFVAVYGVDNSVALIESALAREAAAE
jgi:lysyl-tRNA synthetase class 1